MNYHNISYTVFTYLFADLMAKLQDNELYREHTTYFLLLSSFLFLKDMAKNIGT